MGAELSGARGSDQTVPANRAAADGVPADRTRGMTDAQLRAENDAYNKRHAELIQGQAEANRIAGMFSPIGHVPLTPEARAIVARQAAAKEAAAKDPVAKDAQAGNAVAGDAARSRAGPVGGELHGREGGHPGEARDAPGSHEDAPGSREARETSLEERMAKLIEDRVQAAADGLKTEYEAKLEAVRAELDDVHADLDSMKVVSRIAAEKLQAEREAHRDQLDSLQKEIDSLRAQADAGKTGQPGEVKSGETGDRGADHRADQPVTSQDQDGALGEREGTDQETDTVVAEPRKSTRWYRAITSENVGLAGTVLGAAETVTQFAMHATPDGVVGLGVMALGVASVVLGRAEKHRNGKGKA